VNGSDVATNLIAGATVASIADTTVPVLIGSIVNAAGQHVNPFGGLIDEVGIYNRALSATQIQAIYDEGSTGKGNKVGNSGHGIVVSSGATNNTIGGATTAARNIISGNAGYGVLITDSGSAANVVEGNYIGTDITGTQVVANIYSG